MTHRLQHPGRLLTVFVAILALAVGLAGCQSQTSSPVKAPSSVEATVQELKAEMTDAFAGLEMYAADHELQYPESLDVLIPEYIDSVPIDPLSQGPVGYEKTARGFRLSAHGNYSEAGAEVGFPKMNQDGFFVLKESEFPQDGAVELENLR
jgi:hypothetical protein